MDYNVNTTMEFVTNDGIAIEDLLAFLTPFPANTMIRFENQSGEDYYTTISVWTPLIKDS